MGRLARFRDACTGLFTSRKHAEANPHSTVRESKRVVVGGVLITAPDGRKWTVHADGVITGFPEGCVVASSLRAIAVRD
jgi:hypothetical protein